MTLSLKIDSKIGIDNANTTTASICKSMQIHQNIFVVNYYAVMQYTV